ncbi:LysE family translocator [Arenibacter sp. 6A1]|uniref:LysE family translocator n=1 Tax=Arenibacter sp. 6A1 TaxID=2720391 RepID=UPI001444DEE2|nr:LysE family translocator [Arenibacter sp. 6A1]NKI26261.1 LysE family translocator [Arenibacter sp. 6A1]
MNYEILYTFVFSTALLAISPGPDNIYVLVQSMCNGKKYGIATVAGLMTGCLVHATLLAFGVSALIKENEKLFFIIKLFGALYLFYLAYRVYKSSGDISISEDGVPRKGLLQLYKQGFIMNVLNPKVTIFFLAFFPGFLFSKELNMVVQFYILTAIFIIVSFVVFSGIAILSGTIATYIKGHPKLGSILKWVQIIVFTSIGIYLLLSDK